MHPLIEKQMKGIESWTEWKQLWDAALYAEQLHSLLHFGFDVLTKNGDETNERIQFYLSIADGHSDFYRDIFRWKDVPEDGTARYQSAFGEQLRTDLRRKVARKAFEMLCLKFFKRQVTSFKPARYIEIVMDEKTLQAIIGFFLHDDAEAGEKKTIANRDHDVFDSHLNAIIVEFLLREVKECWKYPANRNERELYRKALPQFVKILWRLDRFDLLLQEESCQPDEVLATLEAIAMSSEISDRQGAVHRKPCSIEEAAAFGVRAAQTLILLRIKKSEQARLEEIRRLKDEQTATERKLKSLQGT